MAMPSRQTLDDVFGKDLFHMPHALLADQVVAVGRGNAGAFLPSMLQSIESQIGKLGGIRVSIDPKNPAMVMELIDSQADNSGRAGRLAPMVSLRIGGGLQRVARSRSRIRSDKCFLICLKRVACVAQQGAFRWSSGRQLALLSEQFSPTAPTCTNYFPPFPGSTQLVSGWQGKLLYLNGELGFAQTRTGRTARATVTPPLLPAHNLPTWTPAALTFSDPPISAVHSACSSS